MERNPPGADKTRSCGHGGAMPSIKKTKTRFVANPAMFFVCVFERFLTRGIEKNAFFFLRQELCVAPLRC
jgi:hypothetical protein